MADDEEETEEEEEEEEFQCEICGDTFSSEMALRGHMNKHRTESRDEIERQRRKTLGTSEGDKPLDPQKQMHLEMSDVLEEELAMAPGGSESKAEWITRRFEKNDIYKKDDLKLYNLVADVCPKMRSGVVNHIVDSVFDVKKEYSHGAGMQRRRQLEHGEYEDPVGRRSRYDSAEDSTRRRPTSGGRSKKSLSEDEIQKKIEEKAEELYKQKMEEKKREEEMQGLRNEIKKLNQRIAQLASGELGQQEDNDSEFDKVLKTLRLMEEFQGNKDDKSMDDILKESNVLTRDELEAMQKDQAIDSLSKELKRLQKQMSYNSQNEGDFSSDDAKIIAQGLNQLGRKMEHGHDTVKHVIQNLPQILGGGNNQQAQQLSQRDLEKIENELDEMDEESAGGENPPHQDEALLEQELDDDEIEEE